MYGTDLYVFWCREQGLCKIGRSAFVEKRLQQIRAQVPFLTVELKGVLKDAGHLEHTLHQAFRSRNSGGEWFSVGWEEVLETAHMYNRCLTHEFARPRRKAKDARPKEDSSTCELSSDD